MKKRKDQTRLQIYISDDMFERIKEQAMGRNITISLWVRRAIIRHLHAQRAYEE